MSLDGVIGIDVGGSRIKGAVIDPMTGKLQSDRLSVATPASRSPDDVAAAVAAMVGKLPARGPVGVTLPCVVHDAIALTAANIDPSWIGTDAGVLMADALDGRDVTVINDADAAGMAEARHGTVAGHEGTVLLLTFGTGIGSALLRAGQLVPNTEFGHIPLDGVVAERRAAASARVSENLSWPEWCCRVNRFIEVVEMVVRPDVIVVGGGISVEQEVPKWWDLVTARASIVPAMLANNGGMVGAAMAGADAFPSPLRSARPAGR